MIDQNRMGEGKDLQGDDVPPRNGVRPELDEVVFALCDAQWLGMTAAEREEILVDRLAKLDSSERLVAMDRQWIDALLSQLSEAAAEQDRRRIARVMEAVHDCDSYSSHALFPSFAAEEINPLADHASPSQGMVGWLGPRLLGGALLSVLFVTILACIWSVWFPVAPIARPADIAVAPPQIENSTKELPAKDLLAVPNRSQNSMGSSAFRESSAVNNNFDARKVRIDSGSARITLPAVGYMLIDGPAEVDLINPLRAKLNRGRIRVRVTETSGRGFVVETPDGNVTDLSTEFGLEVAEGKKTGVVVFDGEVDLQVKQDEAAGAAKVQRLVVGEAVAFNKQGELDRISSITTGRVATFQADDAEADRTSSIITKVTDNLQATETRKFYEIVSGGMNEDAIAYVDRSRHEWNGATAAGIPKYLLGADYVKTFNMDKTRGNMEIQVTLSRPAELYVFFDERLAVIPKWLREGFQNTGDRIAMDLGPLGNQPLNPGDVGIGPGDSVDNFFTIWKRIVKQPETMTLGPNLLLRRDVGTGASMYGIAAVPLTPEQLVGSATPESTTRKEK